MLPFQRGFNRVVVRNSLDAVVTRSVSEGIWKASLTLRVIIKTAKRTRTDCGTNGKNPLEDSLLLAF
jgi:hypothetical protein